MWDDIENNLKRRNNGTWFKLNDDDHAKIVILSDPEAVEKDGHYGQWTAYSVEIYNVTEDCLQTWEMGGSAIRGLIDIKKPMGLALVVSSILRVQRKGIGKETRYMWSRFSSIDADTANAIAAHGARLHHDCELTANSAKPAKRARTEALDPAPF